MTLNFNRDAWFSLAVASFLIMAMITLTPLMANLNQGVSSLDDPLIDDDTLTTPFAGNAGCLYPPCNDGVVQLTLMPTDVIQRLPTMVMPATPAIPATLPSNFMQQISVGGGVAVIQMVHAIEVLNQGLVTDRLIPTVTPCTVTPIPIPTVKPTLEPPDFDPPCDPSELRSVTGCFNR